MCTQAINNLFRVGELGKVEVHSAVNVPGPHSASRDVAGVRGPMSQAMVLPEKTVKGIGFT
jgi:hypothetical protein